MATAEIAPVVSAEMLTPGTTLTNTEKGREPFVIPLGAEAKPVKGAAELTVEFTESPPRVTVKMVAEAPSARMNSVMFGALTHPNLRLRKPIPLEVSTEDSAVVLTWTEIDEFGCGHSLGAAMDNFGAAVLELYHRLHEPVQLGPDLENVKHILDSYIESRTQR